jgi:putative DNA primase/helicase
VIRQLAERRYTPAQVRDKLAELQDSGEALGHYYDCPKGFEAALEADIQRTFTKPFEERPDEAAVFNAFIDPAKPSGPPRREIKIIGGALPATLDAAEQALIEQGVDLFQRGDVIVRPGDDCAIKIRHDQTTAGKRLFEVSAVEMREHMTASASFEQWDGRKQDYKRIDCPEMVAAGYLARKGRHKLRTLTALIDAPTMRLDGTILDRAGYDEATGLYLIPTIEFPTVPAAPTRGDASEAIAVLKGLVGEFPFVLNADRSVWLSAVLTAPIRAMLPTAPLHGFDAPVAGSGKGKLVDTVAMIATGRPASVFNQGRSEEETEKRLGSILMTGDLCINMDNCTLPLEGDFLCSALTAAGAVRVRILGRSEAPRLPMVATIFATGNNLTAKGDMTRRMIRCTIDPKMERPETRTFNNDPVEDAQRGRGKYLTAVLTILRAHAVANRPQCDLAPLGSFEEWSRIVRAALVWLGEADPCDTMNDVAGDDEEREALATGGDEVLAKRAGSDRFRSGTRPNHYPQARP